MSWSKAVIGKKKAVLKAVRGWSDKSPGIDKEIQDAKPAILTAIEQNDDTKVLQIEASGSAYDKTSNFQLNVKQLWCDVVTDESEDAPGQLNLPTEAPTASASA